MNFHYNQIICESLLGLCVLGIAFKGPFYVPPHKKTVIFFFNFDLVWLRQGKSICLGDSNFACWISIPFNCFRKKDTVLKFRVSRRDLKIRPLFTPVEYC